MLGLLRSTRHPSMKKPKRKPSERSRRCMMTQHSFKQQLGGGSNSRNSSGCTCGTPAARRTLCAQMRRLQLTRKHLAAKKLGIEELITYELDL